MTVRTCVDPSCGTVLSRYNVDERCSVHRAPYDDASADRQERRRLVLAALAVEPMTRNRLARRLRLPPLDVYSTLRDLREAGRVEHVSGDVSLHRAGSAPHDVWRLVAS